ncbi:PHO85 cyclin-1 [Coemansia sp. RSA 376]|nr:PHO85 cyclin-1 [Coemansia sp. S680]KAJ2059697.1 PHO85 cyclin-1 [Coemansia sp. S155-1]KAJ2262280.1 PHO85 cyclin-1 [Coemansia sp. RSA 376]
MSTQIDRGHSAQRPTHLNVATPLSARTLEAIQCEITKEMIAIIATHARAVIPCTPAAPANPVVASDSTKPTLYQSSRSGACERLPSPPTTPGTSALSSIPPLDMFITNLVLRSRVQAGTLICTLVYLRRLRRRLPKEARGMECTCHRIFLATLIVAGKYLNDASPKNKYWARYSTVFTVAEVNLMEKQLLFLLDFDLRIDNDDLNDAASSFFVAEAKPSMPLTPTTPPFGVVQLQAGGHDSAAAANMERHAEERASMVSVPMASMEARPLPRKLHDGYTHPESTKTYPATLGLGGHREIHPPAVAMNATATNATEIENTTMDPSASDASLLTALKQPLPHSGVSKRQHRSESEQLIRSETTTPGSIGYQDHASMLQHKSSVPFDAMQDARYKTPAGPVHQITADDMVPLRPSPKKRAVSRGHYGNIPHPSPVYHCATVGTQSSAATTAAASALTASSACFLQPLEQASIAYASSRYQQQRYDPHISRGANGEAASRGLPRMALSIPSFRGPGSANSSSTASPAGNLSSSRSSAKQAEQCTLRHQSTLPDFSQLSKGAQPTQPPVARLASGSSYAADSSPVHTLVYGGCSPAAVVAGSVHHQAGSAKYSRQQTCSAINGDNSSAPAYALTSLSVDAQGLTLSEATNTSTSKRPTGEAAAIAIYADVSRTTHDNGLQTEYVQAATSGGIGNSTGWHLKSRILHPLRGWFGSSRQNQHNSNYMPPAPPSAMSDPAQSSSAKDEHTRVSAAALCNRHVATHSMSPTFLDTLAPQTASAPVVAHTGTCAAQH